MNLFSQKRGKVTFEQVSLVLELLAAAIVLIALIFFVKDTAEDTLFEKNYLARDIALVTTTVYASPGDLVYVYDFGEYAGKFDVTFKGSIVTVSDVRGRVQYWFGKDENLGSAPVKIKKAEAVAFVKTPKELKIGGYGGSVESLAIRAVTEEEKKELEEELEEETRKQPTPEPTPLPTEFYLCENKCTADKKDKECAGEIKTFDTYEECQKEIKIEGRIIFLPVNWKPDNFESGLSGYFDEYNRIFGIGKKAVYLSDANCEIDLDSKDDIYAKLSQCVASSFGKSGYDTLKLDDIVIGAVKESENKGGFKEEADGSKSDGFTQRGESHKNIFLRYGSDSFVLAHEIGHLERLYCEEYVYEEFKSVVGETLTLKFEDYEVEFGKPGTFKDIVNEVVKEYFDDAIDKKEADPNKAPKISFSDSNLATAVIELRLYTVTIKFENKNNEIIEYTPTFDIRRGWAGQNTRLACTNLYPKCCLDSPDYSALSEDIKKYGKGCHPANKAGNLCVGGPCSSPDKDECRSIMGAAGYKEIKIRGLPIEK